ncbi:MAG: UDP-3-O-(3-hydroxymyristoyl)glucosamine N-acyltransferase [Gemmatimonadaceae bacterium]|nr:UDP-3-O-(3-hydroxymyristoyl)glucosamine N-acyltransferase [Gemmatimonadaceae bacterium]
MAQEGRSGGGAVASRSLTARRIAELVRGELRGDGDLEVSGVAPIERARVGTVTFLGAAKYAPFLETTGASVVLVSSALAETPGPVGARVVVASPQEALLSLLPHFHAPAPRRPGIDATVRIGRGASIGEDVEIGPYVVIGEGAVIGDRARVGAFVAVGPGVTLGEDVQLYPHVTLYSGTSLGARVIVHAGARLGCDGFGYVFASGAHQKIPHVGRCVLEADVEIGANTTIDRGSIDDTVIGQGTKIDNLVQIGHNVRIGRLCLVVAQAGISGSSRVGDGCVVAGQAGIGGHLTIGDGARVAAQAGVFGDVPAGETWSGYPARPHREALRSHAALFKLSGMIRRIEKLLGDDP